MSTGARSDRVGGIALSAGAAAAPQAGAPAPAAALFGREKSIAASAVQHEIHVAATSDRVLAGAFTHPIAVYLEGAVDVDALYSALHALVERHEALRGRLSADGRRFLVRERMPFELPLVDLSMLDAARRDARLEAELRTAAAEPFDLAEGPLFRAFLVRREARRFVLVFSCHAAVVDGWSLNTLLEELPLLYNAFAQARPRLELAPAVAWGDYLSTVAQRDAQRAGAAQSHWRATFPGGVPALDLPLDRPRPRRRQFASRRIDHRVDASVAGPLQRAGAAAGASPYVSMLAVFALFLARICGQDDVVVGVPAAGQIGLGRKPFVGQDSRVVPLRCRIREDDTYVSLAARLMDDFLGAFEHQWLTLPQIAAALGEPADPARPAIASVSFSFDPGMKPGAFRFEGLQAHHYFIPREAELFEWSVNAVVDEQGVLLECTYATALFDDEGMVRRLQQLEELMRSAGARPQDPVAGLAMVPAAQARDMDARINATAFDYERERCVDELVGRMAAAHPDAVAVESTGERAGEAVTYAELWRRSGRIANAIIAARLGPRPLVGVMLERNADLVAVLLGVWRAGGAFVPLDPGFPAGRLRYMVEHSRIGLLLTQAGVKGAPQLEGVRRVDVDDLAAYPDKVPALHAQRGPGDLAYVLYTSGSTGDPKGVQIPHRALNNFLATMRAGPPGMPPDGRLLAVTTLSFDIAQLEIWLPLVAGATVVMADRATAIDGRALAATLKARRINFLQATPSTWRLLLLADWPGDAALTALCGGEALPRDLAEELAGRTAALWNVYGPTETTVWSTVDRVQAGGPVTIGRPIGNTQAYVLDARLQWVPQGCVGELWLGGDGVALGYLGREDLTRERFVDNPYTGRGRMYRTGDLVRLRADGRLEYVGRNDFQVKVNGYRIELAEVQLALTRCEGVAQCVVAGRLRPSGEGVLVAYVQRASGAPSGAALADALRARLRAMLPEYMVPGMFVEIDALPLTANRKIDVKALPDPFAPARPAAA